MQIRRLMVRGTIVAIGMTVAGAATLAAQTTPSPDLKTLARQSLSRISGELKVAGLKQPVDVVRDKWGIPHIYAQSQDDLFFAQGYVIAQDRLWQMEWWRRTREGRLAEVLGPRAVSRDRIARMLNKLRGPVTDAEWTSYHQDGKRIFTAFANGVNAFMKDAAGNLPVEFKLTGITPEPWTAETLLLRTASFGDAANELRLSMSVAKLGAKEANRLAAPDPWDDLAIPEGFDPAIVTDAVIAATRTEETLPRPEVVSEYRNLLPRDSALLMPVDDIKSPGSNNWVVSGAASTTGKPVVSNDPHREVTNPSLRYISHLVAPGWNVIGASEPPFVGVHVGHNERVAWGLTIVGTDFQDVFVEDINPANANQVMYNGQPEAMQVVTEEIKVKGEAPRKLELRFTRHGPVFYVDEARKKAYVLRSIFTEPGTASYLGGLRFSQAKDCKDFLAQAMFWKAPSENQICGDVDGNIGWQASALTPNRKGGWVGRLPVPGTGKYEWDGFRAELPKVLNPARGYIVTANHNVQPSTYQPPLMFKTTNNLEFERITRLRQLIVPGRKLSIDDHKRIQHDSYSLRGAADQPAFRGWRAADPRVERARAMVAEWDLMLERDSAGAAVYETWRSVADPKVLDYKQHPADRRPLMEAGLAKAVEKLTADQGSDPEKWRWGRIHRRPFPHAIVSAFDLPSPEDSGGAGAVAADGASYREILDVSNWDNSQTVNTPGQSGQPESPFYGNLLQTWIDMQYFPMSFSKKAVDDNAAHRLKLIP